MWLFRRLCVLFSYYALYNMDLKDIYELGTMGYMFDFTFIYPGYKIF